MREGGIRGEEGHTESSYFSKRVCLYVEQRKLKGEVKSKEAFDCL